MNQKQVVYETETVRVVNVYDRRYLVQTKDRFDRWETYKVCKTDVDYKKVVEALEK